MPHVSRVYSTCVCPAEQRAAPVKGQAVRQAEVVFDQDPPVGPVHVRGLDLGRVAVPVGPVQIAVVETARAQLAVPPNTVKCCTDAPA